MPVLCFWRKFIATGAAILASSFGLTAAVFASGRESLGGTRDLSTMNDFVAKPAKGNPIANVVTQFWVIFPLLYVVGLYFVFFAAVLAGIVIANINSVAPLSILVTVALFVAVRLTRCEGFAFSAAILGFKFSVCREKLLKAISARQFFPGATLCRQLAGARPRASGNHFGGTKMAGKRSAADNTLCAMARVAVPLPGVIGFKLASAQIARNRSDCDGWNCSLAVSVFYAKFCFACDFLCTSWKRALFTCCHTVILPHCAVFCNLATLGGYDRTDADAYHLT